ncbi:DUF4381 domain-containing protein [Aquimarina hainanensis]|uniref:DUF4381 domain-containing protein n=1 Tax=Aquimarina hainanensis TaxID=1578017 RepID=A0ABW5N632_9FLAO
MMQIRKKTEDTYNKSYLILALVVFLLGLGKHQSYGQVKTSINATSIKIGEELKYTLKVEVDTTAVVVFPEGATFSPLEVIESYAIDSTKKDGKLQLLKEYGLTQFDSGHYTIPQQHIRLGDKIILTDSLKVEVRDVPVDTTKQKMYAIKPLVEVESKAEYSGILPVVLMIIGGVLLIAVIVFLLLRKRKKKIAKEKELPPYERAIQTLQEIDQSGLLAKDSHKEYYSKLSDTARKYIDEEIYDHAMESTTDELITRLESEIASGSLTLDIETVKELENVLKTADMAKFAKSKPDLGIAKADRTVIEQIIHKTKEAIPEPTEEELLADETYRQQVAIKQRNKNIVIGSVATVALVTIMIVVLGLVRGFGVLKDDIFGHPTKELAEKQWITSEYGAPAVTISTPEVLIRNTYQLTEEQKQILKGNESFTYGSLLDNFYIVISGVKFKKDTEVDLKKAVEGVVGSFEAQGAKNITVKDDEYKTLAGAEGIKIFGTLEVENPVLKETLKKEYVMLNFAEGGGFQQITVVYNQEDRYAKEVADRIVNSVELKSTK